MRQRQLQWEGCFNIRDLGGLPTIEGTITRWKVVIRADLLGRLNTSGYEALLAYGIKTIIDIRGPNEVEVEPSFL